MEKVNSAPGPPLGRRGCACAYPLTRQHTYGGKREGPGQWLEVSGHLVGTKGKGSTFFITNQHGGYLVEADLKPRDCKNSGWLSAVQTGTRSCGSGSQFPPGFVWPAEQEQTVGWDNWRVWERSACSWWNTPCQRGREPRGAQQLILGGMGPYWPPLYMCIPGAWVSSPIRGKLHLVTPEKSTADGKLTKNRRGRA